MYYRPKIGVAADVIPYYEDGEFKLLFLQDFRDWDKYGEGCPWVLLTTKDFVEYKYHGEIIERGTKEEQDLYIFTGSVFKHQDEYYVFYTGHNPHLRKRGLKEQKVLLAKGESLTDLKKVKDFVFESPDYLEMHDFRDPFIYVDEQTGDFKMLLAARVKEGPWNQRGVTMVATSKDLLHWTLDEKPFYAPKAYFTHECPDLFKMGDWYYLIFSEFSDKVITRYRYSKNQNGPWLVPPQDSFDGHAYYAAKSVSDGQKRYLFGWNPIKLDEKDEALWQWGGNIVPHEIYQNADGTLSVRIPETIDRSYHHEIPIEVFKNDTFIENEGRLLGDRNNYNYILLNELPQNCKVDFDFKLNDKINDFGVTLRMNDVYDRGYFIKFEALYNRMIFSKLPRHDMTIHAMIDTERNIGIETGKWHHVKIIIEKSVVTVYYDDKVAMNARMFDFTDGRLGFYSNLTEVELSNIKIHTTGD